MNKQKKQAFTLVELIVVITILAILWTIAFISLQWYSTDARDSTRISDISTIKSALELYNLDAGKYPIPTNGVDITYSGSTVWTQWTIWETVYANLSKLDKIPKDPITDKEYTYSTTANKYEYQLWGITEGDSLSFKNQEASAWLIDAKAYVAWSYNWLMTKSNSWSTCNILAIPSIITNNTSSWTDLQTITNNNWFVYRWYKNLPSSFKWSKFNHIWWFAFTPNKLLAYSDTWSCSELTNPVSSTARVNLIKWLQDSYSGTVLRSEWEIANIVDLDINISSPST